ncbi:hypothetical protein KII91_00735 [Leuconostoc gelidum subsp. gelidum]|uniref:hypothetical protein n=1 Tax=Leuconostoc gelidum TaxID=1244 RepID=UPI001CC58097|nr:hypothetical protein [Leuconostoc gelidum]MBZ5977867.1 hypothetical protein [Leuconostoc gelidum subsp. gelidum]MBZ6001237.1 hypothetical protein [Leuconostoc gelidum subsp. gelidum]
MLEFINRKPLTLSIIFFLILLVGVLILVITVMNRKGNRFINKGEIKGNIDNSFVDNSLNITQVNTFVITEPASDGGDAKGKLPWPTRLANWIAKQPDKFFNNLFNMKDDGTASGGLINLLIIFFVIAVILVLFLYTPPILLILILILGIILLVQYLYLQLKADLNISFKLLVNLALLLISSILPFINHNQYATNYWIHTRLDVTSIQTATDTFKTNFDYFFTQLMNLSRPESAPVAFGLLLSISTLIYLLIILYKMGQTQAVSYKSIIFTSIFTVIFNFLLQNLNLVYSIIIHYQQK